MAENICSIEFECESKKRVSEKNNNIIPIKRYNNRTGLACWLAWPKNTTQYSTIYCAVSIILNNNNVAWSKFPIDLMGGGQRRQRQRIVQFLIDIMSSCVSVSECVCHPWHQTHRISNSVFLFRSAIAVVIFRSFSFWIWFVSFHFVPFRSVWFGVFDFDSIMPENSVPQHLIDWNANMALCPFQR